MKDKKTGLNLNYSKSQNTDVVDVICSKAKDQDKCQLFVDRLAVNSNSLDRAADRN